MSSSGSPKNASGRSNNSKLALKAASVVAGGIVLAACSPGTATKSSSAASSATTSGASASATSGAASVASTPVTLTLFSAAGLQTFEQDLANAFHAKYPAITVKLNVVPDNTYNTVLPRLMSASGGPDIAAPADLISNSQDGLLASLDSYASQYGWNSSVPSTVLARGEVSSQGVVGSGTLFEAGGAAGPLVGVYYNRSLLAKAGITSIPQTVAEFGADLAKAKAAGITPIVASNQDGLIGHLYSLLLGDYMGPSALNALVNNAPGATLNTPAAVQATTMLETWIKDGYFNSDANAIQQEQSYGTFSSGGALFMVQGSWMLQSLPSAFASSQLGVFDFPPATAGGPHSAMLSNSLSFSIAANSPHKAAAALFLNFLTTPAAAAVAVQAGYGAVGGSAAAAAPPTLSETLSQQIQSGFAQIDAQNGFTNWLQNSAGAVNTAETQELQLLFAGKTSPAAMVASLESTYSSALAATK